MPVPIEFLRGILGILCVFFAHMAGRSAAAVRAGRQKNTRLYAWLIRTTVCGAALVFRHPVDAVVIGVYVVAAALFAGGYWAEQRPKKNEDPTHEIFPDGEGPE